MAEPTQSDRERANALMDEISLVADDATCVEMIAQGIAETEDKPPVNDHHAHVCEGCGHLWWHRKGDGERRLIHTCTKCGCGPYMFGYNTRRDAGEAQRHILDHI